MAEPIDELSLTIEVKQKNVASDIKGISAAIDKLAVSLRKLGRVSAVMDKLSNLKMPSGITKAMGKAAGAPPKYRGEEVQPSGSGGKSLPQAEKGGDVQKRIDALVGLNNVAKSAEESAKNLSVLLDISENFKKVSTETVTAADGTQKLVEKFELLTKTGKKTATVINGVVVSQKESAAATTKHASAFKKLTKAIGRIALYRTIRSAIKSIVQTWQEGLQNFAQYNEETNKAASDVKNSFTQIKNTIGVTAGYLMQTLAPLITSLSDSVVGLLDSLNMALAKFQGKDYFSKAKKGADDYAKSLKKANAQLASFDTFTTLGGGSQETSPKDMFEEASVAEEWDDAAETFASVIELVNTVFESVKQIIEPLKPLFKVLLDTLQRVIRAVASSISQLLEKLVPAIVEILGVLVPIITDLLEFLTPIILEITERVLPSLVQFIGDLIKIVARVIKVLSPIIQRITELLQPFVDMFLDQLIDALDFIADVLEFISPFLKVLCDILEPILKLLQKVFGGVGKVTKGIFSGIKSLFGFANGGSYQTGDYFMANENGNTELIASTNSGGSVMNIDQWASISYTSFYRALSDYNAAQNGQGNTFDIDTLGRGIASNNAFISEMNRRNSALKLR